MPVGAGAVCCVGGSYGGSFEPLPPVYCHVFQVCHAPAHLTLWRMTRGKSRLTVTVPRQVLEDLHRLASLQGRSASNLAAFLLENALRNLPG